MLRRIGYCDIIDFVAKTMTVSSLKTEHKSQAN